MAEIIADKLCKDDRLNIATSVLIETPSLATKVPPLAPSPIKPLLAPLHSLNAPSPPLALNVTSDDQYYVRKSDDQYSTPDPTRPLGTGCDPAPKPPPISVAFAQSKNATTFRKPTTPRMPSLSSLKN